MKMIEFLFKFYCNLSLGVHSKKFAGIGSGNGMAPNRLQVIIWNNADPIHWRVHAVLGGDEF